MKRTALMFVVVLVLFFAACVGEIRDIYYLCQLPDGQMVCVSTGQSGEKLYIGPADNMCRVWIDKIEFVGNDSIIYYTPWGKLELVRPMFTKAATCTWKGVAMKTVDPRSYKIKEDGQRAAVNLISLPLVV